MEGQEFTNYEQYEGEIIATNPETKEKIYFVAMEGNPLIVRSMFPEDVPYIVIAERKKTSSKKRKHARQLYNELEKKGARFFNFTVEVIDDEDYTGEEEIGEMTQRKCGVVGEGRLIGKNLELYIYKREEELTQYLLQITQYMAQLLGLKGEPILLPCYKQNY